MSEAPVRPGDILAGKYRVESILGAGNMGVVVEATHVEVDKRDALKFMRWDKAFGPVAAFGPVPRVMRLPPEDAGSPPPSAGPSSARAPVPASVGSVKCWGDNTNGQLGLGDTVRRGDGPGEMGDSLPSVSLGTGKTATAIAAGYRHTCVRLNDSIVKCWGDNTNGQLGLGDTVRRGDGPGEMGDSLPSVNLGTGKTAMAIAAGSTHTCARLNDGNVKCWGYNTNGEFGLGDTAIRGDGLHEMGDSLPSVDLGTGKTATTIAVGINHTCARLNDSSVKCWGYNYEGLLGLGDTATRGDGPGEMGDSLPSINLGTGKTATAIVAGWAHTCALLNDGGVKCWGNNAYGQLGLEEIATRGGGPNEMGDLLLSVNLGTGRIATAVAVGANHTCALLNDGSIKCWGRNNNGQLGLGDTANRGYKPGEMGDNLLTVKLYSATW